MELIKLGDKTYYIKNNTNIGVYRINERDVILIDSGIDSEVGRKILKVIRENDMEVVGIINTHSHSDHIGGNNFIQSRTNCKIYNVGIGNVIVNNPILEPMIMYGASPMNDLKNKFLMAKESKSDLLDILPDGLSYVLLTGHTCSMIGIITSDNVFFLGDAIVNSNTIEKYHVFFLDDIASHMKTLDYLCELKYSLYVPSHGEITSDISELIKINRDKMNEIIDNILNICLEKTSFEDILKKIFDKYELTLNLMQYYLVGNTIKAYLKYLLESEKLKYLFEDNKMYYITK